HFPGVEGVSISHFSLSSVASAPDLVASVSEILEMGTKDSPWIAGQTGLETGSPRLARMHMANKSKPFSPEEWPEVVKRAYGILMDNHWIPCATIILGLPGENDDDIVRSIDLVEDLKGYPGLMVPLFLVPLGGMRSEKPFRIEDANELVYELIYECWKYDMRWLPYLANSYVRRQFYTQILAKSFLNLFMTYVRTIMAPRMEKLFKLHSALPKRRIGRDTKDRAITPRISV
ncbi:MAG: hypothetical protein ACE5OY_07715, partial [Candidatus Bathyarchaeia archaeon]